LFELQESAPSDLAVPTIYFDMSSIAVNAPTGKESKAFTVSNLFALPKATYHSLGDLKHSLAL
jgi:hypothetical protein